jgi:hypothetical protein
MASYDKFDPRVDDLVVETITHWGNDVRDLPADDRRWLAEALHTQPQLASQVQYRRAHTGFTREITVTAADIERLYAAKFGR